ncbi:hypothetical protein EGW08_022400 [Elysia chlorotica]|uniref:Protein zwilch n=1 Tax=Elysia chlorotica TaxID=188477 RepID=A0A3S0ZL03_ELYCH|nr:hypothetical protein EGW08_022400 [Elysia chlorotica]
MPPDQDLNSDVQSKLKFCWLEDQKCKVEVVGIDKRSCGSQSSPTLMVAQSLLKLLGSNLSQTTFHFVSKNETTESNSLGMMKNGNDENSFDSSYPTENSFKNSSFLASSGSEFAVKDESVIGSPLKLDKIANLASLSPAHQYIVKDKSSTGLNISMQIPLQDARHAMQKFMKTERDQNGKSMLAILCNAKDTRRTLMIGIGRETIEDQDKLTTFSLTMKKIQMSCLEKPVIANYAKKYRMESAYNLLDTSLGLGSITLRAKWDDSRGNLKISKPMSTEFSLELETVSGNKQSPVFSMYRELQKVSSFMSLLKNGSVIEHMFPHCKEHVKDATRQLKELFAKKKNDDRFSKNMPEFVDVGANRLNLSPAMDRDFTDELWDVLSCCSSMQQMVNCVRETFDEMRRGTTHLYVSTDNRSTLANLSRAAASGLAVFPPLSDQQLALRLVTEIGLEKLRKLYHALMVTSNKLCLPAHWEKLFSHEGIALKFMQEEDCDKEILALCRQFSVLEKLHDCLECVAIVDAFTDCQDLTKIACAVLSNNTVDCYGCKLYKIQVNPALALPEIEKRQWTSVRREAAANGILTVETFLHGMPEGILENSPCDSDCVWLFTAQHNSLQM